MNPLGVEAQIQELKRLRRLILLWISAIILCLFLMVGWSAWTINRSVSGFFKSGPSQELLAAQVESKMKKTALPRLRGIARQTFAEMQPVLKKDFETVNESVPSVAQTAIDELHRFSMDLSNIGTETIMRRFDRKIESHRVDVESLAPGSTPSQINQFIATIEEIGHFHIRAVNRKLMAPYQARIHHLFDSMNSIRKAESANVAKIRPDWDMGLLIVEDFHKELGSVKLDSPDGTEGKK